MYYKTMEARTMEAHSGFPGLPTAEVGVVKSVAEAPTPVSAVEHSAEALEDLDRIVNAAGSTALSETVTDPSASAEFPNMIDPVTDDFGGGVRITADHATRPKVPEMLPSPAPISPRAEAQSRAEQSLDSILKDSKGVSLLDRLNSAKNEKQWRQNVRETSGGAVMQAVRIEKQNVKYTKEAYGRSGRRAIRQSERANIRSEINKRRAEGKLSGMQARLARIGARGEARRHANKLAETKITAAKGTLEEARNNRTNFRDNYGRRNNSLRKNYQRTGARMAVGGSFARSGDYLATSSPSLSEMWNSDEYRAKREAAALKRREEQRAATANRRAATKPKAKPKAV